MNIIASILLFVIYVIIHSSAARDKVLFCGGCLALVEELNWETGITNPKKKIQIGSYRINSQGDLASPNQIPLATSEVFLTEVFEHVCLQMWFYAKSISENGNSNFIRVASRDGKPISQKGVDFSQEIKDSLRYACDTILEENDDWLVPLYKNSDQEVNEKLCVQKTGLCSSNNVTEQMWSYASAVMAGISGENVNVNPEDMKEYVMDDDKDDDDDKQDDK